MEASFDEVSYGLQRLFRSLLLPARYLQAALSRLPAVEVLTDPENIYTIKWRYRCEDSGAQSGAMPSMCLSFGHPNTWAGCKWQWAAGGKTCSEGRAKVLEGFF